MSTKTTKTGAAHSGSKAGSTTEKSGEEAGHFPDFDDLEHTLEERIVHRLSGLSSIEADIAGLVRKTVADTLRAEGAGADELTKVVNHVILNTLKAAEHLGYGLTMSVRSVTKGIIMGVSDVNGDITAASTQTIRSVIRHASALGSDLGLITRHAVDGMIDGAVHTGGDVAGAGRNALEGAIEEASTISKLAVSTVRQALIGIVGSKECRAEQEIVVGPGNGRQARTHAAHHGSGKTAH